MHRDAPICIVGAGMSGILAGEKLRALGYRNIDIIEAAPQLGGYTETIELEGKVYDFQAHLIAQQDFGADMAGTALQGLLDRYPMELHDEALYFVSQDRAGRINVGVPPLLLPFFQTLTPDQLFDGLIQAWRVIEAAIKNKTGPGLTGLSFERSPGETWETFRARHPPLVGAILQSIMLYANMRRVGQPAECVIGANAFLSGNVSQLAKALLAAFPDQKERQLARMPASLVAQLRSKRPIAQSFVHGFNAFLRKIIRDNRLDVLLNTRVMAIEPLAPGKGGEPGGAASPPGAIRVTFEQSVGGRGRFSKTYARVLVSTRPRQTCEIFCDAAIRDLFSEASCPQVWTRTYVIKAEHEVIPFPRRARAGEALGFWLIDPYASYTDSDVEQSLHRITAANRQHESPYWLCFSNSDPSISPEEAWSIARGSLFLFRDPQLIAERLSNWPVYPGARALREGWADKLAALQGRDGVHFVGEVISGPTIEAISTHIQEVIPRWFGAGEIGAP